MSDKIKSRLKTFHASVADFFKQLKPMKKPFLILFIIFFIAIIPIIRANFYYIDDIGRSVFGYREWAKTFSRHLSDFFAVIMHTDMRVADISPLTQLIAAVFMAASGAIIAYVFSDRKKVSPLTLIAIIPMALSPYFLECFSYKFDSPYMAMSVFVSVLPLLFYEKHPAIYVSVSAVATVAMCSLYQPSSGIYPMLILFLCLRLWNNGGENKKTLMLLIYSVAAFILGLLIFKLFLMKKVDTYTSTSMLPLKEIIPGFIKNITAYYKLVLTQFRQLWLILTALCVLAFIVVTAVNSTRNKLLSLGYSVLTLVLSAFLAFGVYPILSTPLFAPRAMYGFGVLLALICVGVCSSARLRFMGIASVALSWCFVVFAFMYGNALSVQKDYTEFRMQMVIEDLTHLDIVQTDCIKNLKFEGHIPKAPAVRNIQSTMLNTLVPNTFGGGWTWAQYYFFHHRDLKNVKQSDKLSVPTEQLELKVDTVYHTIYTDEQNILVKLK